MYSSDYSSTSIKATTDAKPSILFFLSSLCSVCLWRQKKALAQSEK